MPSEVGQFDEVPRWVYDPPADGPRVVHEDLWADPDGTRRGYVAVDKPAGLLSVPGIGPEKQDCARSRVAALYPWATGPMTVHRLDVATSGVLLVALDKATHRNLSVQFERRRTSKRYIALVGGTIAAESGIVRVPMRKDLDRPPTQMVDFDQGKESETRFRVLAHDLIVGERATRVELEPITGRTHQLRVHMADSGDTRFVRTLGSAGVDDEGEPHVRGPGTPIVGDELYGGRDAPRLMLHAQSLTLNHPETGKMMSVRADSPF